MELRRANFCTIVSCYYLIWTYPCHVMTKEEKMTLKRWRLSSTWHMLYNNFRLPSVLHHLENWYQSLAPIFFVRHCMICTWGFLFIWILVRVVSLKYVCRQLSTRYTYLNTYDEVAVRSNCGFRFGYSCGFRCA